MNQKTVFITGATGYIGSHVARVFRRAGYRVLGLARNPDKAAALEHEKIKPVLGSLQQPGAWRNAAATADLLVHAAADYSVDTFALDRSAVAALIAIGRDSGARFIYTSGVWVVGNTDGKVVDENARPRPIKLVASRVDTENLVRESDGFEGIVIRPGVVYGAQGGLTGAWFTNQPVVGDGRNHWTLVHADDLAQAYVLAAQHAEPGSVFNVVDDSRLTLARLVEAARRAAGLGGEVVWRPLEQARQELGDFAAALAIDQQVSNARVKKALGWRPVQPDFVTGAPEYFEAWRAARQLAA